MKYMPRYRLFDTGATGQFSVATWNGTPLRKISWKSPAAPCDSRRRPMKESTKSNPALNSWLPWNRSGLYRLIAALDRDN